MLERLFHNNKYSDFKECVRGLQQLIKETSDIDLISETVNEACLIFFDNFSILQEKDLKSLNIGKETRFFATWLIKVIIARYKTQQPCESQFLKCLEMTFIFFKEKDDLTSILKDLIFAVLSLSDDVVLDENNLSSLFKKFALNRGFNNYVLSDTFLTDIWCIWKLKSQVISKLIGTLLCECLNKGQTRNEKNYNSFLEISSNEIMCVNNDMISFLVLFYKKLGNCSIYTSKFVEFNNAIIKSKCYELLIDLYSIKSVPLQLKNSCITHLLKINNISADHIIIKIMINENLSSMFEELFPRIKNYTDEIQEDLLTLISKQNLDIRDIYFQSLFPPWKSGMNCFVLSDFIRKNFKGGNISTYYLNIIFNTPKELLKEKLNTVCGIIDLIITLIDKEALGSLEPNLNHFEKIIELIILGSSNALLCFDKFCRSYPPVTYKEIIFKHLNEIPINNTFLLCFENIINDVSNFNREILTPYFVKWCFNVKVYNIIASLALDGPHPIIDKEVIDHGDFPDLSKEQIENLIYARKINSTDKKNSNDLIRIPSFISFVNNIELPTLFDFYSVSSYLVNNSILSINNNNFCKYGIQYLSTSLANLTIDKPYYLYKLTDPEYVHHDIYQFQNGSHESYIMFKAPFSFDFKADKIIDGTVLCEFDSKQIILNNSSLTYENKIFNINPMKWNNISFQANNFEIHIIVNNNKWFSYTFGKNLNYIGSKLISKSTFYVKFDNNDVQVGSGVINVYYKGIYYYYYKLNVFTRILENGLNSNSSDDLKYYIFTLINVSKFYKFKISEYIKILMIEKKELINKQLFFESLSFIDVFKDTNLFFDIFFDYNILASIDCNYSLNIINAVLNFIQINPENKKNAIKKYSLPYLIMDLVLYEKFNQDNSIKIIKYLFEPNYEFLLRLINTKNQNLRNLLMHEFDNFDVSSIISNEEIIDILPPNMLIQSISKYSKDCISNNVLFNIDTLKDNMYSFIKIINICELWISLLTLLVNINHETFDEFMLCKIEREQVLHVILTLIPFLLIVDNKMFQNVFLVITEIVKNNNLNLSNYQKEIQNLLKIGIYPYEENIQPVYYETYEPGRTKMEGKRYVSEINQDINVNIDNFINNYFKTENLWFGKDIIIAKREYYDRIKDINPDINKIDKKSSSMLKSISVSNSYILLLEFAFLYLSQTGLSNINYIFTFGSDTSSEASLIFHKKCVIYYIERQGVDEEILKYIYNMIIIGWWDSNLFELFKAICDNLTELKEKPERYNNLLSYIFCLILGLETDYSQYLKYDKFIFSQSLLAIKNYSLFILYLINNFEFFSHDYIVYITEQNHELSIIDNEEFQRMCKDVYNEFLISNTRKMDDLYSFFNKIRVSQRMEDEYILFSRKLSLKKKYLLELEKYSFELRYDLTNRFNENCGYAIWKNLPQKIPHLYQIATSAHPISPPTLYVPYVSKSNFDNCVDYGNKEISYNFFGAKLDFFPKVVSNLAKYHFFDLSPSLLEYFFSIQAGPIDSYHQVNMVFCQMLIHCVLAKAKNQYFLIINAKLNDSSSFHFSEFESDNGKFIIHSSFLDFCAGGYFGKNFLFFGHPVLHFKQDEIVISSSRLFCHTPTCIEIWFESGYSILLIFENSDEMIKFESMLKPKSLLPYSKSNFSLSFSSELTELVKNKLNISKFQKKWVNNRLSSFAYLLILNFFADRTFGNYSQYPVMPWTLPQRDLSKPMGQQDKERGLSFEISYKESSPDNYFYGSLYMSPALVIHFMLRIQPFTNFHIDLQNGFDVAERLFYDFEEDYDSASRVSSHNVKELIPEVYMLPEMYMNVNKYPIPKKLDGESISDCALDNEPNYVTFVLNKRKQLDNAKGIEKWIDLIFGYSSRGEEAIKNKNLFYCTTYGIKPTGVDFSDEIFLKIKQHYGQVPTQLFTTPHPARNTIAQSRWPLLTDTDHYSVQKIKTFFTFQKPSCTVKIDGTYGLYSTKKLFSEQTKKSQIQIDQFPQPFVLFVNEFQNCSFSDDKYLFCGSLSCGNMFIFRAICNSERKIVDYKYISSCLLPSEYLTDETVSCSAISSHIFLACEAIGSNLFCFHISTGKIIRKIQFHDNLIQVLINDSYQSIIGIGNHFIEVYTINGTKIAFIETEELIKSASCAINDEAIYLATGHPNGCIKLWYINSSQETLTLKRTLSVDSEISSLEVLNYGSALYVLTNNNDGYIFTARGIANSIIDRKSAICCGSCGNTQRYLNQCKSCSLFFCDKCCSRVNGSNACLCKQCLDSITEYANTINDF